MGDREIHPGGICKRTAWGAIGKHTYLDKIHVRPRFCSAALVWTQIKCASLGMLLIVSGRNFRSEGTISHNFWRLTSCVLASMVLAGTVAGPSLAQEGRPQGSPSQDGRSQAQQTPSILAVRVAEPPVIDGLLNEATWSQAEPITQFFQQDPQEGAPATEATEVRILYDTYNIYFGVLCRDSSPANIRATELRRDNDFDNDDIFEIILDTFYDRRNGYLFRINPRGTQYDATVTNEGQTTNRNWDEKWDSQTRITEDGWSAEIAIPFKSLRFLSGDRLVWGANFHRTIKRKNEDVFWTAYDRDFRFEQVSRAGRLEGLSDILGFQFRFKPFFTTGTSKALQDEGFETKHLTDVGIEVAKYMVTPQLALDLTVNPDFAQADVDEVQVNLTRFSLFFPEKREYFQEGSGIFTFGAGTQFGRPQALLFHSRRIGRSDTREEIPILGGIKLTGKQGPFDIGLLNMQTQRFDEAAGQNFTVVRVKGNVLARSYIGGILTRNTAGAVGNSNLTGGVDASFTFFQNLNLRGFLAKSDSRQFTEREWAGQAKVEWDSDRIGFELEHVNIQEEFDPPMGFVSRRNSKRTFTEAAYKPRPGIRRIRQFEFAASLEYLTNQQGELETRANEVEFQTDFESGDALSLQFSRNFERLVEPFRIRGGAGTIPVGDYPSLDSFSVMFRPYRGRAVSGNIRFEVGDFFSGKQTRFGVSPQIKVTQNLSIDPDYEWNRISLPGIPSFSTQEFNGAVNYAFSRKWLTRTTVLVNSQDSQYGLNFRLNYIFRPGDDLFVVYNETRNYGSQSQPLSRLQNRALILKLTFSVDR